MGKYHINSKGDVSLCQATKENCPFGRSEEHFPTAEKARRVFELRSELSSLTGENYSPSPNKMEKIIPKPFVTYTTKVEELTLTIAGFPWEITPLLANGRANYIIFENFVREKFGLLPTTGSDHVDALGRKYEQKSFVDEALGKKDLFHTAPSSTFGANNHGPLIKKLLSENKYEEAFNIVYEKGYSKNDFYIYTNTGNFSPNNDLKVIFVPRAKVIELLDKQDPRCISRSAILALSTEEVRY